MKIKDTIKEYHAQPYMSKTKLWQLLNETPAKFYWAQTHPTPPSPAMQFGSALHKYVLEPDGFFDEFAVAPSVDRRTKAGKEEYAKWLETAQGKDVVAPDDMVLIGEIAGALRDHPRASFLLQGEIETSYYWSDEATNIPCQARPDCVKIIGDRGYIIDLKTCAKADTDTMSAQAYKLGYDMQAFMFKHAVEKELDIPCDFLFVCVEKEAPYLINILQADDMMLQSGEDRFREAVGIYKDCLDTGCWYGYEGKFNVINNLPLPKWVSKEFE